MTRSLVMYEARQIVVNALSEVFDAKSNDYILGDVNVGKLKIRLGRKPTQKDFDNEFKRQLRLCLYPDACQFVQQVWRLQKLNTSRFRIWSRGRLVCVSTEFTAFVDDADAWHDIQTVARLLKVKPYIMWEGPHLDRSKPAGAKKWICGPNHGRLERQVSFDTVLPDLRKRSAERLFKRIAKVTDSIWSRYGVGVL